LVRIPGGGTNSVGWLEPVTSVVFGGSEYTSSWAFMPMNGDNTTCVPVPPA
jgi:hypothetical protein